MPRQRMIQPEIWTDEGFLSLSIQARLLFVGMISGADDDGRGLATDRCLKAKVFPADDITLADVRKARDEVAEHLNVQIYSVDGKEYYQLLKWRNHQRLERPTRSNIPPAPTDSGTTPVQLPESSGTTPAEVGEVGEGVEELERRPGGRPRPPVDEVIELLNTTTSRHFSATTKATRRLVEARFRDGHTLEDFRRVIQSKVKQWGGDPKMAEYLRPETLFGTKFDSYLATATPLKTVADVSIQWTCMSCGKVNRSTSGTCAHCRQPREEEAS